MIEDTPADEARREARGYVRVASIALLRVVNPETSGSEKYGPFYRAKVLRMVEKLQDIARELHA